MSEAARATRSFTDRVAKDEAFAVLVCVAGEKGALQAT